MGIAPSQSFVIVGASVAGGRAAEALRDEGFDGRIVLIGAEPDRPYERPPLSKEYLRGEMPQERVFLRPRGYYDEQRIELRLGTAVRAVDMRAKFIELEGGERIDYDKLLIATGAGLRRLNVPGGDLPGVFYLRTMPDSTALSAALTNKPRVFVVGAGFIGCEVAASARTLGCEVTMIDVRLPIAPLGDELGRLYQQFHRERGVDVRTGVGIGEFRGAGRVEEAVTDKGDAIACDLAIVGIGVAPNVDWLAGSPVAVDNGVVADEFCRTNVPDVFAAGDVANWWHPSWGERLRIEHFDNAQHHGVAAAKSMLGRGEPYDPVPFFWTDQYDLNLQYVGFARRWDKVVMRGDPASRSFSAFYLVGDRLRACAAVNRYKDMSAARRLIRAAGAVSERDLADESVDLKRQGA